MVNMTVRFLADADQTTGQEIIEKCDILHNDKLSPRIPLKCYRVTK